ncbi:MAG: FAD-binding oxidoreductase [Acidobacteriota bacterium]
MQASLDLTLLRQQFKGTVIAPGDAEYETSRRVWNAMIDRRPAAIARCRDAADVIAAVAFARARQLPIAVRGGGHNVAGRGTCDDGLVIDCCDMRGIRVDAAARTATAEPGLRWEDFDRETQKVGLATTGGTVGDTGIAGLTLGGGFGWLGGLFGMTVDNLIGADVVLASGEWVHASATEHPDLFWALRGGGGNFGIVTSFEYRLHPVGPMIVGGMVLHPFERAAEVLRFYRDFMARAPDHLTVAAVLVTAPDGHKAVALAAAYIGAVAEGELAVAPLKTFGPPVVDMMGPHPYLGQQGMLSNAMPPNVMNYWKADFVDAVSDDVIEAAVAAYAQAPSPLSSILFFPIHGAASRVAPEATAYPHRQGVHMGLYALWKDPEASAANIAWVRAAWAALQPFVPGGVYVNELGDDEGDDRVRLAYGRNYERLARVKRQYDPDNVLCLNANILPA